MTAGAMKLGRSRSQILSVSPKSQTGVAPLADSQERRHVDQDVRRPFV